MKLSTNDKIVAMADDYVKALEPFCILKGYRGSIAHGTYDEKATDDDKDIMGVFVPPMNVVFGMERFSRQGGSGTIERMWSEKISQKKTTIWDAIYYDVPKFLRLLFKQNPNVIMLLWLKEKHYLKITKWGQLLIDNRDKLLSLQCKNSFVGYAHGQIHRAKHTNYSDLGAKRKAIIDKFGYDTKNMSHCIRLLKMGLEVLTTGEMIVERPDNNLLLGIKRGEWKFDDVEALANELFLLLDKAVINSPLQPKVDRLFVNDLCVEIVKGYYND